MPVEQSVNEQTADIKPDHVDVSPGESFASFDDLESAKQSAVRNQQLGEKTEQKKGASEPKAAKSQQKSQDKKGDEDGLESDETDEKAEPEKGAKDKLAQGEVKAARTFKLKNGDQETELSAAAEVPVKINGKEELVKFEELVSNYSGKKAWSDEFGKLGAEKQRFKQERDVVMSKLGEMFEVSQKDPISGLMKMAELAGMDPMKYRQDFLTALQPALEKRLEMSDAERRAADAEAEAAFYRSQTQSRQAEEQQRAEYSKFEATVRSQLQAEGVSDQEFESTYQALAEAVQTGRYKPQSGQLTVEDVLNVAATEKHLAASDSAIEELGIDLSDDEKDKFLRQLIPMARREKMSPSLVKETVKEFFSDRKAANLSRI
jgi:hypothetical protein